MEQKTIKPEDFAKKTTEQKWAFIAWGMSGLQQRETAFGLRRRFNPHHPIDQQKQELRSFRLEQYTQWVMLKDLYAEHRDELANTCENEKYSNCKSIMERILTQDLDDALRGVIDE